MTEEEFWANVLRTPYHWFWQGLRDRKGYGYFYEDHRKRWAHRRAWELLRGPIADGLHTDHLCRTPICVWPDHLEMVTSAVNTLRGFGPTAINARKTVCYRGHPLSGDNLYVNPAGKRFCRTCVRANDRRYKARHRPRAALATQPEPEKP